MSIKEQIAALWEELPAKWKYIAIDGDRSGHMICAYTHPPVKSGSVWEPGVGEYRRIQMVKFPDEYYTRPEAKPEYSVSAGDCPGCMGPCGRCETPAPAYTAEQLREMANSFSADSRTGQLLRRIANDYQRYQNQ